MSDLRMVAIFVVLLVLIALVDYRRHLAALAEECDHKVTVAASPSAVPGTGSQPGPGEREKLAAISVQRTLQRAALPILLGCVTGAVVAAVTVDWTAHAAPTAPSATRSQASKPVAITATPGDGEHKYGNSVKVEVNVKYPPPPGHSYWLMAQFITNGNTVYKAQYPIPTQKGVYSVEISLASSDVGSARSFYVVDADRAATRTLQKNYDNSSPAWDGSRTHIPPGTNIVTIIVPVVKQVPS